MALTKEIVNDQIEVVRSTHVQVREARIIKEDGVELTRAFFRKTLSPGTLDASDNLVNTDISGETSEVQGICNTVWTTAVKNAWKAKLIADKSS